MYMEMEAIIGDVYLCYSKAFCYLEEETVYTGEVAVAALVLDFSE